MSSCAFTVWVITAVDQRLPTLKVFTAWTPILSSQLFWFSPPSRHSFRLRKQKVGRFQLFRVNFNIMPAAATPHILASNVGTAWLKIVYSPLRNCLLRQRSGSR